MCEEAHYLFIILKIYSDVVQPILIIKLMDCSRLDYFNLQGLTNINCLMGGGGGGGEKVIFFFLQDLVKIDIHSGHEELVPMS